MESDLAQKFQEILDEKEYDIKKLIQQLEKETNTDLSGVRGVVCIEKNL